MVDIALAIGGPILGWLGTWLFYKLSQQRAELLYSVIVETLASKSSMSRLPNARLMVGRINVDEVVWTDIVLTNSGNMEVRGGDLAEGDPLRIAGSYGNQLSEFELISSRDAINPKLRSNNGDTVVTFDVLAPGDTIIIRFFSDDYPKWWDLFEGEMKNNRFNSMSPYEIEEGQEVFDQNYLIVSVILLIGAAIFVFDSLWGMSFESVFHSVDGIKKLAGEDMSVFMVSMIAFVAIMGLFLWLKNKFRINARAFNSMRSFVKSARREDRA